MKTHQVQDWLWHNNAISFSFDSRKRRGREVQNFSFNRAPKKSILTQQSNIFILQKIAALECWIVITFIWFCRNLCLEIYSKRIQYLLVSHLTSKSPPIVQPFSFSKVGKFYGCCLSNEFAKMWDPVWWPRLNGPSHFLFIKKVSSFAKKLLILMMGCMIYNLQTHAW